MTSCSRAGARDDSRVTARQSGGCADWIDPRAVSSNAAVRPIRCYRLMEDVRACLREADEAGVCEPPQRLPRAGIENFGRRRRGCESRSLGSDERRLRVENEKKALGPELGMEQAPAVARLHILDKRLLGRERPDPDSLASAQQSAHALDHCGAPRGHRDLGEIFRPVEHAVGQRLLDREEVQDRMLDGAFGDKD
jgi:hypothetical protein